ARGGVQPVVHVTANGDTRADVPVGQPVALTVIAETPDAGGTITKVEWDFDGSGAFAGSEPVDGTQRRLVATATHTYETPGTYFVTARVSAHRDGDVTTPFRQLSNVASARIVVA
ncbi:MAG TPA: PKD domain-containing protein, partial [Mycobacteriales bacterium]|nr:PKD domain-containing protein [Mycobacteriales bacterium]